MLNEAQAGIKIAGRNINNFRYADDTTLMSESEEELKSLLTKVREWKSWLKTQHSENEDHGIQSHHFMANRWGNSGNSDRFFSLGFQNHCRWWLQPWNKRHLLLGRKALANLDSILKSRDTALSTKIRIVKDMVFLSSQIWMWALGQKENWTLKSWCFWTVVLKKTLESPLDCKEIQPVSPKGNQPSIFIGRTETKAEAPILWPPDLKSRLIGKDPDAGKDWRQKQKGITED